MAGDWIKMRTDLHTDPRVARISDAVGCNAVVTIGALQILWSLADTHTKDGRFGSVRPEWIDQQVTVPGFAAALMAPDVGWLCTDGKCLYIPDFDRHNGKSGKARAQTKTRVQAHRSRNAPSVTEALPEKRREEKSKKDNPPNPPEGGEATNGHHPPTYSPEFLRFWDNFPKGRRQGKATAWRAWKRHVKAAEREEVIAAAAEYAESAVGRGEYVKSPAPWINGRCWEDDRAAWARRDNPNGFNPEDYRDV